MEPPLPVDTFPALFFADFPELFIVFEDNGTIHTANNAWQTVTGNNPSTLPGNSVYSFLHESDRDDFTTQLASCRTSGCSRRFTLQLSVADEECIWCTCHLYFHRPSNLFYLLLRNVTDQLIAAERMIQREERLKILVDNVNEYLYSVQYRDGMFVDTFHNRQCEKITGYTAFEFSQNRDLWYTMIHKDDRKLVTENLEAIKATKQSFYIEHRIIHKSGEVRWISNSCVAVINDYEKKYQYIGFILDITEKKLREHELYNHATYDALTGIYNRRAGIKALERCIRQSLRSGAPCTVCYFDINNLKEVNDRLGHFHGDDMIKTAVMIVQHELRTGDVFTRIGGDEFLLIFENTTLIDAQNIVRRIINAIIGFNSEQNRTYRLYVSYGYSEYSPQQTDKFLTAEELIETADKEMYFYKERSRKNFTSAIVAG
jgi:diguanylate cyclase (GGDEF)-like protein/PAS domain S-box-containing protein